MHLILFFFGVTWRDPVGLVDVGIGAPPYQGAPAPARAVLCWMGKFIPMFFCSTWGRLRDPQINCRNQA